MTDSRTPSDLLIKGRTIGPCWICNGKLDVLTDGQGGTRTFCPICQQRLGLLEEIAQRTAALAALAQQARVQVVEVVPWQKRCVVCGMPIETRRTYCDTCHGPMLKKFARDRMRRYRMRVGCGVCPCCRRQFQDLKRHMHRQHPSWAAGLLSDAAKMKRGES